MNETWKPWRNGDYEVSDLGRVRRARPGRRTFAGRMMTAIRMKIGYLMVGPTIDGRNVNTYVHEMVAECFIGPRPDGAEINHIDGDKSNARASNLEYVTHAGNMAHARRTGLMRVGEDHGNAKLSNADVADIRASHAAGAIGSDMAREYGVSPSTVSQIVNNKRRTA